MASQPQPPNVGQAPADQTASPGQTPGQVAQGSGGGGPPGSHAPPEVPTPRARPIPADARRTGAEQPKPGARPADAGAQGPAPSDGSAEDGARRDEHTPAGAEPPRSEPGFRGRGRMRRRLRYLRTARELSYRDLGGLMFDLHRFGGRRDELLAAKLERLGQLDHELRSIETALHDRQPVAVLRQAGVRACPRCGAIHSSEDRFCPHCGLQVSKHAESPRSSGAADTKAPPATKESSAVPPLAAPAAAKPVSAPPPATSPTDPAAKTPPPGAPVGAQVPSPGSALPAGTARAPDRGSTDLPAGAGGARVDGEPAEGPDQPTRIIRRPEPPEGSTAE